MKPWRSGRIAMLALGLASCGPSERGAARPDAPIEATGGTGAPAVHIVAGHVPATGSSTPAIVVLEPLHSTPLPDPVGVPFMDQDARTFIPSMLFARSGRPTEFRNSDTELHNVNVKDAATHVQAFNVAVPTDEKYVYTFSADGIYDVSCDVHAGMAANVVVTSSPYVTFADRDGRFRFPAVIPGRYEAIVYAGPRTIERAIEVSGSRTEIDFR